MKVHACFFEADERDFVTGKRIWRIHFGFRGHNLGIALTRASRFAGYVGTSDKHRTYWVDWR